MTSTMTGAVYDEGYYERGEGSNYTDYGDDPGWLPTARIVKEHMGEGATVLEVGCAKGYFVRAARKHGLWAYGEDISEYAIAAAPLDVRGYLDVSNAVEMRWDDASVEAVCSWEVLEHIPMEEIDKVIQEMYRILDHGGVMWHRIALEGDDTDHDHTHVLIQPESWWRGVFTAYGLERCRDEEVQLSAQFSNRDWKDRFFVYRKVS